MRIHTQTPHLTCKGWDIVARKQHRLGPRCFLADLYSRNISPLFPWFTLQTHRTNSVIVSQMCSDNFQMPHQDEAVNSGVNVIKQLSDDNPYVPK